MLRYEQNHDLCAPTAILIDDAHKCGHCYWTILASLFFKGPEILVELLLGLQCRSRKALRAVYGYCLTPRAAHLRICVRQRHT